MPRLVELQYNPYIPRLQVLIDGTPPADFSRLIQYSDEDIWLWICEIMDTLYSEVRDDYFVCFTGTLQDAKIIKFVCENSIHCVGFRHADFLIADTLPKRMGKLNQLIKKAGITTYDKTVIEACFLISPSFQQYIEEIAALDINNLFCAVQVNLGKAPSSYSAETNSVLFVLTDSIEEGERQIQRQNLDKPAFILIIGSEKKILKVSEQGWFVQTPENQLFDSIFDCFMQVPLILAFRKCVRSIKGGNKIAKEVGLITGVEPLVTIRVGKEVEIGKSIRISTLLEPSIGEVPKLIFKVRDEKIASCDGLAVYGLQEGIGVLAVYKLGSKQPFFTKEIKVFKRNRITRLILSEDSLCMGIGDKKHIRLDYYPLDADNSRSISWKSSNENIIKVDSSGNVTAIGIGECRLICTAENISSQCMCRVKPYLSDLKLDLQFDEKGGISMQPLQELSMSIQCIPEDCIDSEIIVESADLDIVNVVKKTLYAKNAGTTTITLKNSSARIHRSFQVTVSKKGFFKTLFG